MLSSIQLRVTVQLGNLPPCIDLIVARAISALAALLFLKSRKNNGMVV